MLLHLGCNLPHHFTVILLRPGARWPVKLEFMKYSSAKRGMRQQLIAWGFIWKKQQWHQQISCKILACFTASPACAWRICGNLSARGQMAPEELFSYLIMPRWPPGNEAAEWWCRGGNQWTDTMLICICSFLWAKKDRAFFHIQK